MKSPIIDSTRREQQPASSQPVSSAQVADLSKITGARTVLTGSIVENRGSIEITGQLIDTETGTILSTNDVYKEDKEPGLSDLLDRLASKFKRDLPLIEGTILEVTGNGVIIDAGKEKKIRPGTRFICYRQCPPARHPVTGQLLAPEPQIIGILKVQEVFDDYSKATVETGDAACIVSDKVITR